MAQFGGYEDNALIAQMYDALPAYAGRGDIEFYSSLCAQTAGEVLELGCGTGRVLIPSAQACSAITGLDGSPHMLAQCRAKADALDPPVRDRIRLVRADMTSFSIHRQLTLVTIPFRPFQHLVTTAEQIACLRAINQHLIPGGLLAFDVFQPSFAALVDPARMQLQIDHENGVLPDGRRFRRAYRHSARHPSEQFNEVEFVFEVTGPGKHVERITQKFPMRYFFRYEIEHLLARSGFKLVDLFGGFDRSALTDDSQDLVFVAKKVRQPS